MGFVSRARDVPKYAPIVAPELQSDQPAWVVQFGGDVFNPRTGTTLKAPTCVVISGVSYVFGTGLLVHADGQTETPIPPSQPPILALPTLAP
jgi:hypothetical protein